MPATPMGVAGLACSLLLMAITARALARRFGRIAADRFWIAVAAAAATSARENQRTSWISSSWARGSPPVHGTSKPSMSEAGNGHGCEAT